MKVCMLYSWDHQRHVVIQRHITTLMQAGFDVVVIDHSQFSDELNINYKRREIRPLHLWGVAITIWRILHRFIDPFPRLAEAYWTLAHFFRLLQTNFFGFFKALKEDADFYQAHDIECLWAVIIAGKLKNAPSIFSAHELYSEQGDPKSLKNRLIRKIENSLIPLVEKIVLPNQTRADFISKKHSLRTPPYIVANYPPNKIWPKTNLIREVLFLGPEKRIVVYHGTLMPGRSLDLLIKAVRFLKENIILVIFGDKSEYYYQVLEPEVQNLNLPGRIFFMEYVRPEEIMNYVASADFGIVIYKNINLNNYYCAPTKLYEYIMANVPVAVCNFPELLLVLKQFKIGYSFDPDDPCSIAEAINKLSCSTVNEMGDFKANLSRARELFNWEKESYTLLSVFNR